jgi:hypothetical protein
LESVDLPEITLTIDTGKVNYLGEIYIDTKKPGDPGTLSIPYKSWNRDNAAAAGWIFGLAGSVVYSLTNSMGDAEAAKVMDLETDENFAPQAGYQIIPVTLHIKAAKDDQIKTE